MVGMAQVEVDKETGSVEVLDYAAVVDCGTPINPNRARVQTEGGIVQGIGMALFEDVTYNEKGRLLENSPPPSPRRSSGPPACGTGSCPSPRRRC